MKKLLLSGAALIALSSAALAADLPSRTVAPAAPAYIPPAFTWTGFYVGVNAGYGFANDGDNSGAVVGGVFFPGASSGSGDGFVGGGQVGYNMQFGQFVAGLEADLQYADLGRNDDLGFIAAPGVYVSGNRGIEWFGTVRGRLGVAFDRLLVYATGGLAYGGGNDNRFGFVGNGGDDVEFGWTLGGGVEYAFTNNLTFRVEGLYVDIDRGNSNGFIVTPAGAVTPVVGTSNGNDGFGVVRAALNYKF